MSIITKWGLQAHKAVITGLLATCLFPGWSYAAVPHLIRYQGTAVDSQGVPLEGPYNLTFRLYDAATSGTKLWEETHTAVPLSKGQFSILLGDTTSLDALNWTNACWLSVQVNTDSELAPRQQITSVPLAIVAEKLAVPVTTSTITDDANRLVPSGAIILWDGAACPLGYTRLSTYDDKFLVASGAAGATGGSDTKDISHTHGAGSYAGPSHTHSIPQGGWGAGGSDTNLTRITSGKAGEANQRLSDNTSGAAGTGAVTGTSAAGGATVLDIRPAFATVLLCKKN